MPTYKTVFRYAFKKGNKVVEVGITGDIQYREYELRKKPGWSKGKITQIGFMTDYDTARAWEIEQAKQGWPVPNVKETATPT